MQSLNGKSVLACLDEVQKSLCTTLGVGVSIGVGVSLHIYIKVLLMAYIFQSFDGYVHIWYDKRYRSNIYFHGL